MHDWSLTDVCEIADAAVDSASLCIWLRTPGKYVASPLGETSCGAVVWLLSCTLSHIVRIYRAFLLYAVVRGPSRCEGPVELYHTQDTNTPHLCEKSDAGAVQELGKSTVRNGHTCRVSLPCGCARVPEDFHVGESSCCSAGKCTAVLRCADACGSSKNQNWPVLFCTLDT